MSSLPPSALPPVPPRTYRTTRTVDVVKKPPAHTSLPPSALPPLPPRTYLTTRTVDVVTAPPTPRSTHIDDLPLEVLRHICTFLGTEDLLRTGRICPRLEAAALMVGRYRQFRLVLDNVPDRDYNCIERFVVGCARQLDVSTKCALGRRFTKFIRMLGKANHRIEDLHVRGQVSVMLVHFVPNVEYLQLSKANDIYDWMAPFPPHPFCKRLDMSNPHSQLRELTLESIPWADQFPQSLLLQLRKMKIIEDPNADKPLAVDLNALLRFVSRQPKLRTLHVKVPKSQIVKDFTPWPDLHNLYELSICSKDFLGVMPLNKLPKLHSLSLHNRDNEDIFLESLDKLAPSETYPLVRFSLPLYNSPGMPQLGSVLRERLPALTLLEFHVENNRVDLDTLLAEVGQMGKLRTLLLSGSGLVVCAGQLFTALRESPVSTLYVRITVDEELALLADLPQLQQLHMSINAPDSTLLDDDDDETEVRREHIVQLNELFRRLGQCDRVFKFHVDLDETYVPLLGKREAAAAAAAAAEDIDGLPAWDELYEVGVFIRRHRRLWRVVKSEFEVFPALTTLYGMLRAMLRRGVPFQIHTDPMSFRAVREED